MLSHVVFALCFLALGCAGQMKGLAALIALPCFVGFSCAFFISTASIGIIRRIPWHLSVPRASLLPNGECLNFFGIMQMLRTTVPEPSRECVCVCACLVQARDFA